MQALSHRIEKIPREEWAWGTFQNNDARNGRFFRKVMVRRLLYNMKNHPRIACFSTLSKTSRFSDGKTLSIKR
jgi:hypothetical protein